MFPARARTRTAHPGVECTNHETTAPPAFFHLRFYFSLWRCLATFPKILCCLSYFQLSVTVFSVFENVLKHGLKCLVLVPKQVCLGLVMEDISTKPIQPLIRSVCFHFQSSQFHTMHPLQTYAMSCKTLLTLLSSLIILRAVTDECFKFCASLIISSARFSCMFWWYCSTASILSSFVSPFLSPVNLLQKHESIHKVKSLISNKLFRINSLHVWTKKKQGYLFRRPWESSRLSKIK